MNLENDDFDPNAGDVAPGVTEAADHNVREDIHAYLIGFGLAILLTAASFYVAESRFIWGPGIPVALIALAVAQIGVHLVFFIHITSAPDNTNNILALAFGVLIVALIVIGSIWIMDNLNHNLMYMERAMQMQR